MEFLHVHWAQIAYALGVWIAVATLLNPFIPVPDKSKGKGYAFLAALRAIFVDLPAFLSAPEHRGILGVFNVPLVTLSRKPGDPPQMQALLPFLLITSVLGMALAGCVPFGDCMKAKGISAAGSVARQVGSDVDAVLQNPSGVTKDGIVDQLEQLGVSVAAQGGVDLVACAVTAWLSAHPQPAGAIAARALAARDGARAFVALHGGGACAPRPTSYAFDTSKIEVSEGRLLSFTVAGSDRAYIDSSGACHGDCDADDVRALIDAYRAGGGR